MANAQLDITVTCADATEYSNALAYLMQAKSLGMVPDYTQNDDAMTCSATVHVPWTPPPAPATP